MKITNLEQAMLEKIATSEFTSLNGATPTDISEIGWIWADTIIEDAEDKGVFTSLLKKGLVEHSGGPKSDAGVTLTESGFSQYQTTSIQKDAEEDLGEL